MNTNEYLLEVDKEKAIKIIIHQMLKSLFSTESSENEKSLNFGQGLMLSQAIATRYFGSLVDQKAIEKQSVI